MTRKLFFIIGTVVLLIFGLAFLLLPVMTMKLYGDTLDQAAAFPFRYWGSAFIGLAIIFWFARTSDSYALMKGILLGGLVTTATGFLVGVADAIWGGHNALIYLTPVLYALFTIGFIYFLVKKED